MKKLVFALCAIALMVLSSCKKEEEQFTLVGRTYAVAAYHTVDYYNNPYTAYYVVRFCTDSTIEYSERKDSPYGSYIGLQNHPYSGTYTLDYPNVHIQYYDEWMYKDYTIDAVLIDGDKIMRETKNSTVYDYILQ